jgi:serine/threonine protein kinase
MQVEGEPEPIMLNINQYNKLSCAIMFRLLLAINYIHEKGVAHRGLNPETIYIDYKDGLIESIKIKFCKLIEIKFSLEILRRNRIFESMLIPEAMK